MYRLAMANMLYLITFFILIIYPKGNRSDLSVDETATTEKPKTLLNDEMEEKPNGINENANQVELLAGSQNDTLLDLNENELNKFKIWRDGTIPYFIDDFSFDKVLRDRIRKFLDSYQVMTGIQFIELPHPPKDVEGTRWVLIVNRMGQLDCLDHPTSSFSNQGVQKLVLGYNCLQDPGDIAAIILSLLGVPPQHNAPNRDDNVNIVMDNIIPDKRNLFSKLSSSDWLFPDHPYDFNSASHYDFYEYTLNGLATIQPKKAIENVQEKVNGLSKYDKKKINMLYNKILNKKSPAKGAQCSKLFRLRNEFSENTKSQMHSEVTARQFKGLIYGGR